MKKQHFIKQSLFYILLIPIAIGIAYVTYKSGKVPSGSNAYEYLYRSGNVYQNICRGQWLWNYDALWQNGTIPFLGQSPLTIYILAVCQLLVGGNIYIGYLMFVGLIFFVGAAAWLECCNDRRIVGFTIGILWFFAPAALLTLYGQGNLGRSFCNAVLPIVICCSNSLMQKRQTKDIIRLTVALTICSFSDFRYFVLTLLGVTFFCLVMGIANGTVRQMGRVMFCAMCALLLSGVWVLPVALQRGLQNMLSSEGGTAFQSILLSLNPLARLQYEDSQMLYWGGSLILVCVLGIVGSFRKSIPCFVTALLMFAGTSDEIRNIIGIDGSSFLLGMYHYMVLATGFVFLGMLQWNRLKEWGVILAFTVMVLDFSLSLPLMTGSMTEARPEWKLYDVYETTLMKTAEQITTQRMTILDGGAQGGVSGYAISAYEKQLATSIGGNPKQNTTSINVVNVQQAIEEGFYPYVFDRLLDLGNDTVIIKKSILTYYEDGIEKCSGAAASQGYKIMDENRDYILYHIDTYEAFGTITDYEAIGIGTSASMLALASPNVKETEDTCIDDYSFEELSQYKLLYLAGFTYQDKSAAEKLITRLSESGTKVVIMADGIPEERDGGQSFLGVSVQKLTFSNGFPTLHTQDGTIEPFLFRQGYEEWKTVFINGLEEEWGYISDSEETRRVFYGTVKNQNIVVLGFNLMYHYVLTKDYTIEDLLSEVFARDLEDMPQKRIVPISVEQEGSIISISSQEDHVNTGIAYLAQMESDRSLESDRNLLVVSEGMTRIRIIPLYWQAGLTCEILGIMMITGYCMLGKRRRKK